LNYDCGNQHGGFSKKSLNNYTSRGSYTTTGHIPNDASWYDSDTYSTLLGSSGYIASRDYMNKMVWIKC